MMTSDSVWRHKWRYDLNPIWVKFSFSFDVIFSVASQFKSDLSEISIQFCVGDLFTQKWTREYAWLICWSSGILIGIDTNQSAVFSIEILKWFVMQYQNCRLRWSYLIRRQLGPEGRIGTSSHLAGDRAWAAATVVPIYSARIHQSIEPWTCHSWLA